MAKVNPNLLRSMIWDLQQIVTVAQDIKSRVGPIDCMSWRYPSKSCDSVDVLAIMDQDLSPPAEHYVKLLELLYDRLFFLINLFVKFFDNIPMVSERLQLSSRLGERPKNISLAAAVRECWERIMAVQDSLLHQMVSKITNEDVPSNCDIVCRGTQTDVCSLLACENCSIAESLLKCLIREIEIQSKQFGVSSAVVEERMRMQGGAIYQVTQWSAMHSWVEAILQDMNKVVRTIHGMGTLNTSLRKEIEGNEVKVEKKLEEYKSKIKVVEEENAKLLGEIRVKETNYTTILKEKTNLETTISKNCFEMTKCKEEILKSESVIQKHVSQIKVLKSEKENLARRVKDLEEKASGWEEERNKLTEARVSANQQVRLELASAHGAEIDALKAGHETEREALTRENNSLNQKLDNERATNAELLSAKKSLEDVVTSVTKKYQKANVMVAQLEKDLTRSKHQQAVLLEYPDLNGPLNKQDKIKGNPIQDMEFQLQANELRIELLQAQNAKLSRTINKLKSFSKNSTRESPSLKRK